MSLSRDLELIGLRLNVDDPDEEHVALEHVRSILDPLAGLSQTQIDFLIGSLPMGARNPEWVDALDALAVALKAVKP